MTLGTEYRILADERSIYYTQPANYTQRTN